MWLTDQTPGDFVVEVTVPDGHARTIYPTRTALDFPALKVPKKDKAFAKEPAKQKDPKKATDKDKNEAKFTAPEEKELHFYRYTAYLDNAM